MRSDRRRIGITVLIAMVVNVAVVATAALVDNSGSSRNSSHPSHRARSAAAHRTGRTASTSTTVPIGTDAGPSSPVVLPPGPAPVLSRIPTTDRVIFLGIDDGIWRDRHVIDFFRRNPMPFTMFLVDGQARAGLAYFKSLQSLGGTVEDHTIHHPDMTKLSFARQKAEICPVASDYATFFGRRPTLFRPPYGSWDATTRQAAAACGMKAIIVWQGSTNNGRLDVIGGILRPGDILLMHFRPDLVENLAVVVAAARSQGFRIARLENYAGGV